MTRPPLPNRRPSDRLSRQPSALLLVALCAATPGLVNAAPGAAVTPTPASKPDAAAGKPAGKPLAAPMANFGMHLPPVARPTHYEVDLALDPTREDFTGTITIELAVLANTDTVWLNAQEITVDSAELVVGSEHLAGTTHYSKKDFLALLFPRTVDPGTARLTVKYHGKMHRNDGDGIYPVKEGDDWYLFTQFEPTDARQAFPCFDEPGYKVPWRLTIHTKKNLTALSNTAVQSESPEGADGKVVRFFETKPMPSYLVAFAVGPFDFVDAGKTRKGVPVRVVVPRGRAADARYPVEATRPLLAMIEDEVGLPYPYPKLDVLAVPVFNAGAMENPGLITFRHDIILSKPSELTRAKRQRYAAVAAHELAHMWFGDLVTHAWWDDIWLNESFATWMETKVVGRWKKDWNWAADRAQPKVLVMQADSLDSARMIRQPIESDDDIKNGFDSITYQKGAAVLGMLERWVGEDKFRKGVRTYLARHAWGNATYDDFVAAVGAAAGRDVQGPFNSFVRQSGVPVVGVALACNKGAPPSLALTQKRYAPLGSSIDPKRVWQIPVCVKYGEGAAVGRACTLLVGPGASMALDKAKGCPAWVQANEDGAGYYRSHLDGDLLKQLLTKGDKATTAAERVVMVGDVNALVGSGAMDKSAALELVPKLGQSPSPQVVKASMTILTGVDEMVPKDLRASYEEFLRTAYGAKARALGWRARPGDNDDVKDLRAAVMTVVAGEGHDVPLAQQAAALADKWLGNRKAIDPEMVAPVLAVAARHGDRNLFDRLHQEAGKTADRQERTRLLKAMSQFIDPGVVDAALGILLTDEFEMREAQVLLTGTFAEAETRPAGYEFLKKHFDKIVAKLPSSHRAPTATTLASLCDDTRRAEIEAAFRARVSAQIGGPRVMDQVIEQLGLCSAARKAQAPSVAAFFRAKR